MTSNITKRRFPKVLADELKEALFVVDKLGNELAMELLAAFRRNRLKRIAAWGASSIGNPADGLEPFPLEYFQAFERLDGAFRKLHHFRNGGAGDYVAADVDRVINRQRASQPRIRSNNHEDIARYLKQREYETSDNKKALVMDASSHFDTSESTVRKALRSQGLSRRKSTVT